jgi:hypothetical protein
MQTGPYVVDAITSVALNLVFAETRLVELTWMSYTRCPAVIVVFAVPGTGPKVTGLEHEEAAEPTELIEKPLSVPISPLATLTAEPTSAW